MNMDELEELHKLMYPVRYSRSYYVEVLNAGDMARLGNHAFFFHFFLNTFLEI